MGAILVLFAILGVVVMPLSSVGAKDLDPTYNPRIPEFGSIRSGQRPPSSYISQAKRHLQSEFDSAERRLAPEDSSGDEAAISLAILTRSIQNLIAVFEDHQVHLTRPDARLYRSARKVLADLSLSTNMPPLTVSESVRMLEAGEVVAKCRFIETALMPLLKEAMATTQRHVVPEDRLVETFRNELEVQMLTINMARTEVLPILKAAFLTGDTRFQSEILRYGLMEIDRTNDMGNILPFFASVFDTLEPDTQAEVLLNLFPVVPEHDLLGEMLASATSTKGVSMAHDDLRHMATAMQKFLETQDASLLADYNLSPAAIKLTSEPPAETDVIVKPEEAAQQ